MPGVKAIMRFHSKDSSMNWGRAVICDTLWRRIWLMFCLHPENLKLNSKETVLAYLPDEMLRQCNHWAVPTSTQVFGEDEEQQAVKMRS